MMFLSFPPEFWLASIVALAALAGIAYLRRLRWRPALLIRFLFLLLVLIAMLYPEKNTTIEPPPLREVLILDQSDSISPVMRGESRARARQWLAEAANRLVIAVGADAIPVTGEEFPFIDGSATDLAAAVDLAAAYLGDDSGRIIFATDSRANNPLAFQAAIQKLVDSNSEHRIETIAFQENAFPADVFVGDLYLPSALWENTPFTALLPVNTYLPGDVTLAVTVNENIVLDETINLPAGQHLIPISLQTTANEIMTISAVVNSTGDPRNQNNSAFAALRVFEAPRVLVLTEDANYAGDFSQALSESGLDADLMTPQDLPDSLTELSVYQVIIADNILAGRFTESQLRTLKDFAQQQGQGLIFSGGRNAFTLGGYKDTVIEPILPVVLEPPPREQNSPLTLVLVIDRSASMDGGRNTQNNQRPISLAREAALRSVETLGPEDFLGILSYNANALWSLRLQQVGESDTLQDAKNAMAEISPSGGTAIFKALNAAVTELIEIETSDTRHIVLLSDGNDDTSLEDYAALAEFALANEITISTIALGVEADQELMSLLADEGQGRFYPVFQPADLPRILIDESRAARDENIREGISRAIVGEANHPVLSGLSINEMPALLGYNALESKASSGAEDVLLSADFEDPLLSVWQFGLGRVAAWTGDIGQEWATDWASWQNWGRLWANLIRYTLPDPTIGPAQAEVTVDETSIAITTRVTKETGVPQNDVPVSFSMVNADGQVITYPVSQSGPGEYTLNIPRPEAGAYRGVIRYIDEEGIPVELAAPVVVNYSKEWQPSVSADFQAYGTLITWDNLLLDQPPGESIMLAPDVVLQRLLILLLLIWPVEIAIRRRMLPWR